MTEGASGTGEDRWFQPAAATFCDFQFQGSSSPIRLAGWSAVGRACRRHDFATGRLKSIAAIPIQIVAQHSIPNWVRLAKMTNAVGADRADNTR
jgi:hypothetical protein